MPTISRIRLTNVVYENNAKRYNNQIFRFDGENGIFLLENGGGKTVFLQTVLQAVIPHADLADRKIKETLVLDNSPAHVAIEWILNEKPRRYGLTAVSLYIENNTLKSYKYVFSYGPEEKNSIEDIPFVIKNKDFSERPASKGEISEYYSKMKQQYLTAETFATKTEYHQYIEENFKIIPSEWYKIAMINSSEGDIEKFFDHCATTQQLVNNLLIPTVEDALQGSVRIDFVQTFEKQREHFKQNKRLVEEIEQFQAIKDKVDQYVGEYSKLDAALKVYNEVKIEAKAFNKYILEALEGREKEKTALEDEWHQYHIVMEEHDHKTLSLDILCLDMEILHRDAELNELIKQGSDKKQLLDDACMRMQNIEITQLEDERSFHEQQVKSLRDQLTTIEQSNEEIDLREKVDETLAHIHGCYANTFHGLEKDRSIAEAQRDREAETIVVIKEQIKSKNKEINQTIGEISAHQSTSENCQKRMNQITNEIYEPFVESDVEEVLRRSKNRMEAIEAESRQLQLRKKEIADRTVEMDGKQDRCSKEVLKVSNEKTKIETELTSMKGQQDKLIDELELSFFNLGIFDSIYSKEPTIRNSLKDRMSKLEHEYEEGLTGERISSRLADLYVDAPFFTADPYLARRLRGISNQVSYVEHGTMYLIKNLKAMGNDMDLLYQQYPFWANTVVTTEKDKAKVVDYINGLNSELTHPVVVLTTSEVQAIAEKGVQDIVTENGIFPEIWKNNLDSSNFEIWKRDTLEEAAIAKEKREEIGNKLQKMNNLSEKVYDYYERYPYAAYTEAIEKISLFEVRLKELKAETSWIEDEKSIMSQESERIDRNLNELTQEKQTVLKNYDLLTEFMQKIKEKKAADQKVWEENKILDRLNLETQRLNRELEIQEGILEEVKDSLSMLNHRLNSLKADELYLRVKETEVVYSAEVFDVLKDRLNTLDDQLKGFRGQAADITSRIEREKQDLQKNEAKLKRQKLGAKYPIEVARIHYETEFDALQEKSVKFEREYEEINGKTEHVKLDLERKKGSRDEKFKPIEKRFGDLYVFEEDIPTAENQLENELHQLAARKKELQNQSDMNLEWIRLYRETSHELEVLAAEHSFASMVIGEYDRNTFLDFEYDNKRFIGRLKQKLSQQADTYIRMKAHMDSKMREYLDFCKNSIREPRLKETAVKGIEKKQSYSELLEYQKSMESLLSKNIKLAEDDRRESDAELQTFLSHLMTYAKNVIDEIDDIQTKTKIKVDGVPKQIFVFQIPRWDEIEAKEELRRYINRLVEDYDRKSEQLTDDQKVDRESIRQYIEEKLSIKNLIMRLLGDKRIKIKCRKVTNDLKVGQAPMTWELSNKWSGGERWSKNMTLFLSILNYLAEKKQYMSASQKRHRTVLLDNPFGKASSKHVLDPVFFVAENLGFQMITVTAHAEGQFVTEYFPVVYSGKLRISSDSDKQIMDVSKTLNTAYFKSESPDSLMRFEETEQMSFFR